MLEVNLQLLVNHGHSSIKATKMKQFFINSKKLESILSERIQSLYKKQLQHEINGITYHFFENTLIITIEGTLTQPEKLLNENQHQQLAKQVRKVIDKLIQPKIITSIEEVMDVKVVDFLCDTTIDTSRTGAIAILGFKPKNSPSAIVTRPE